MLQNVEISCKCNLALTKETNPYLTFFIFVRECLFYNEFLSRVTFLKDKVRIPIYRNILFSFIFPSSSITIFFSLNQLPTGYAIKTIHLSTVKLVIVFPLLLKNEFEFRKISEF